MRYLLIIIILFAILNFVVPRAQQQIKTAESQNVKNVVGYYLAND
jgi:hypothetical protein